MNFTVVIVSYKSFHLIEKNIKAVEEKNQIIIVENSLDKTLKEKFEKMYKNVEVIIPNTNLGYGSALNLGISRATNNFVFCMAADSNITKECFFDISNLLNKFEDFSIISPTYFDEKIYKNYTIYKKELINLKPKQISNFLLQEVDEIDGAVLIINKEKFN